MANALNRLIITDTKHTKNGTTSIVQFFFVVQQGSGNGTSVQPTNQPDLGACLSRYINRFPPRFDSVPRVCDWLFGNHDSRSSGPATNQGPYTYILKYLGGINHSKSWQEGRIKRDIEKQLRPTAYISYLQKCGDRHLFAESCNSSRQRLLLPCSLQKQKQQREGACSTYILVVLSTIFRRTVGTLFLFKALRCECRKRGMWCALKMAPYRGGGGYG